MHELLHQSEVKALHESFGKSFAAAIGGELHAAVRVAVVGVAQTAYAQFIGSLANPTCFHLLTSEQLAGPICLEISPQVVYPMIDRLLGGNDTEVLIPQRPLTQLEQRLLQRITERAAQHLSLAWSDLLPVTFSVGDYQSNGQLLRIMPADEAVLTVAFEVAIGRRTGGMNLCIACSVIEPIMKRAAMRQRQRGRESAKQTIAPAEFRPMPMQVRAMLAQTTVQQNELMSLAVGDIITTDKPAASDVLIEIDGQNKFLGRLGQFHGKRAVWITRVLTAEMSDAALEMAGKGGNQP